MQRLTRNALWNLLGQGVPLVVALATMPLLVRTLGAERFAVLALVWTTVGYFNLVDLGLGRALTQAVATALGNDRAADVPRLVRSGLTAMWGLGLVGTVLLAALTPWLTHSVLQVPEELRGETRLAFWIVACSIPLVTLNAGQRGVLEAHQRFDITNAIRIPVTLVQFVSPLLVPAHLGLIAAVLLAARLAGTAASWLACRRLVPAGAVEGGTVVALLRFGGWMTVSNLVTPLLVTLDRFLIGALVSLAAVTYYVTPYEVVTRMLIVTGALVGVCFPMFATLHQRDPAAVRRLFRQAVATLAVLALPVTLAVVVGARPVLGWWMGADFAAHSSPVLQWLAVGVFINSLAQVPFALIQGAGRPDLTAKLHLLEVPLYVPALWWLIHQCGIEGAAMAWTMRVAVDAGALFLLSRRFRS